MTHDVVNQVPPLVDRSLWELDPLLRELQVSAPRKERIERFGEVVGSEQVRRHGFLANENPPVLDSFDRYGHRSDTVRFHPSYHALMELGMEAGVHSLPWESRADEEAFLERTAQHYLLSQVEAGVGCPLTMTFAGVPALEGAPTDLRELWIPKLTARSYDPRFLPVEQKRSATMGMAMTEKQGGSDVRANSTQALRQADGTHLLRGHKWFCSAPMSDAFLTLAQTEAGLTCFFVPRFRPDGQQNSLRFMRLKNKLGNRANASGELEYHDAWARQVGEPGRGVSTIIEMVNHTRFDCVIGSTAVMRAALSEALHHACHRRVFGAALKDQPQMFNVLADLCLDVEAAWRMVVRLCQAYGRAESDPKERAFARVATAIAKFWVCKRAPMMVAECLECLGGNGYVEDFVLARLYREAPLLSVWEGSGNVIALDLLRAMDREPEAVSVFIEEVANSSYATRQTLQAKALGNAHPFHARRLARSLALQWQAQLMESSSTPKAGHLFFKSRLEGGSSVFGVLQDERASRQVVERFLEPFLQESPKAEMAGR